MTNNNLFSVRFADEFENSLYKLSKKYRNIKADIKPILEQLQKGTVLGDPAGICLRQHASLDLVQIFMFIKSE